MTLKDCCFTDALNAPRPLTLCREPWIDLANRRPRLLTSGQQQRC
jgi:hypothetical protein